MDLRGQHLTWFENVLKTAQNDESIKHIFVESHAPILQPVRKVRCSGQFLDNAEKSKFWKLMEKYGVDLYFAVSRSEKCISFLHYFLLLVLVR